MMLKQPVPGISSVAIAVSATALGFMISLGLMTGTLAQVNYSPGSGISFRLVAGTGTLAFLVTALVIRKIREDLTFQKDCRLLEAFLEHIPDHVFFKDVDSRFVRISRSMASACGIADPALAVGSADSDFFSSDHAKKALADEQEIIRTGTPLVGIEELETWPDGRQSSVLTSKVPLKDRRGQIIGTMGIAHDITDRKSAEATIHYMTLHDALTGLPNRTLLEDRLAQATDLAYHDGKRVGVLMLDLDRFKNINDTFGHRVGDYLLEAVARRLRTSLRSSDLLARLGGDKFVIAVPLSESLEELDWVPQRILALLAESFQIEGHDLRISGSVGICEYPTDGENPEALLKAADAALYEAKKAGSGNYRFFAKELIDLSRKRQSRESDLRQACGRNEFVLHYQPMVSTSSGRITGVEALLRWKHSREGLIPPDHFIPQLEELGLMGEVGRWVLQTACTQNLKWQNEGLQPIRVAVNVSAQQFYRDDIVNTVRQVLRETGLKAEWLELELTESLTLDASENTISIMHELKNLGVSLSLDDFGTGWSSLSYLSRFPLDRLKIDRSFMRDITSRPASQAVFGSIINLGRSLNLECIGEGVETNEQLEYVRSQRCPEIQGFLFSRPVPAADCSTLLCVGKPGLIRNPIVLGELVQETGC